MPKQGAFTFVLHSHLPYCRKAGRWPHGEEWLHEAASETYIPLLNALTDLINDGVTPRLTIGITPILTEQLADPTILHNFEEYLDEKIVAAQADIDRLADVQAVWEAAQRAELEPEPEPESTPLLSSEELESLITKNDALLSSTAGDSPAPLHAGLLSATTVASADVAEIDEAADADAEEELDVEAELEEPAPLEQPDPHKAYLAQWYRDWYSMIKRSFIERYNRDIVGAFRQLQDAGYIEIITCGATHGYLPLVSRDSTIYAQIAVAVQSYERHYGRKPKAIWLPECAYRPAYYPEDRSETERKPGVEEFLEAQGIECFFVETTTIEGGAPMDKAEGKILGPYGDTLRKYVVPVTREVPPTGNSTLQPYLVGLSDKVAAIGRHHKTGLQVWSAEWGYPGDANYREFHRKDSESGMQYWRITGPKVDLGFKDYYHPDWINDKIHAHADHFTNLVHQVISEYRGQTGRYGLISSNYDTELFGHWWFEGVDWMREVLRRLAANPDIDLTTASEYIANNPPRESLNLPESSWGSNGTHQTWLNPETEWMWPIIHAAEKRMEGLVAAYPQTDGDLAEALAQTARELLLLQSSDWPFLVTTGQAQDYATKRFNEHVDRFSQLADAIEANDLGLMRELTASFNDLDNPFPTIDYHVFAAREGLVA
ncbi:1,4-alpha-glucan branching protein domain-containing protein [Herpetosiphon llansteffanensis]|uniref:1,4-alpha-glucan branching protein domain-containing protein n=1 Tax=Herpetosiphon llansteffanensis TaxID=2094568 RepID=UPI000D7BC90E|nr:1,4-alpha-glucan branching protein domain-containing protein [Herpetosiphon llansteffanensis]